MVTKTKSKTNVGNDIPKSSLTSAVTSDLSDAPAPSVTRSDEELEAINKAWETRASDAGIGLIKVDGVDFRYVGIAPARDKDAQTDSGLAISPINSTFTPLSNVPFHPSIRIKDPSSGKFYFPDDGVTSWEGVSFNGNSLIPAKASAEGIASRKGA